MRKKLLLLTAAAMTVTSCASIQQGLVAVANKLHELGEPTPKASKEEIARLRKGRSIRAYLYALGYEKGFPLNATTTVYDTRYLDSGEDATWNIIYKLHDFCAAHGGDFYIGHGIDRIAWSDFHNYGGWSKYFGLRGSRNSYSCEGGDYNFTVELVKGRGGFTSSVEGYIPEVWLYVHHPADNYVFYSHWGYDKKRMEKDKKSDIKYLAGWFDKAYILGGDRYKGRFIVRKPYPMYIIQTMPYKIGFVWYANEYCKANGGELYKDGQPSDVWLDRLIRRDGGWGWPHESGYPLVGKYVCSGGSKEFEFKIYPLGFDSTGNFYNYGGILSKGIRFFGNTLKTTSRQPGIKFLSENTTEKKTTESTAKEQTTASSTPQPSGGTYIPFLSPTFQTQIIAARVVAAKSDYQVQKGAVTEKGYYNGPDDSGCELASVLVNNAGLIKIYNYKVCNGRIAPIGESSIVNDNLLPESVRKAEKEAAKQAKDYGSYTMFVDGYRIYARALRDKDMCNVEVRVLEDGTKLVAIHKINACE